MLRHENEIELSELNKKAALMKNARASLTVGFFESLNLAAIYITFFREIMQKFLEEIGKYFMFPIAAAASVIQAALAWREAYLDGGKTRSVARAVVETVAAAAITTAVIGALAASATFALATPIIFTATLAGKTLFHAGCTSYYTARAIFAEEPRKKNKYKELATNNGIATVAGAVATGAVVGVFLLGKAFIAGMGLAVSLFGAGYALYKGITSFMDDKAKQEQAPRLLENNENNLENQKQLSPGNTLKITRGLNINDDEFRDRVIRKRSKSEPIDVQKFPEKNRELAKNREEVKPFLADIKFTERKVTGARRF